MSEDGSSAAGVTTCVFHPGVPAIDHCRSCGSPLCAECSVRGKSTSGTLCAQCLGRAREHRFEHRRVHAPRNWRRFARVVAVVATFAIAAGLVAFLLHGASNTAAIERGVSGVAGTPGEGADVTALREQAAQSMRQTGVTPSAGDFPAIAERVMRSVVRISTNGTVEATGSGFVVSGQGDILTAAHVIAGDPRPLITFPDGREFEGIVLLEDSRTDVALVHVDYQGAPALALGQSGNLAIGTDVAVLGYPLNQSFERLGFRGATPTLVQGGVAARQSCRPTPLSQPMPVLQIDANLNPGHSGGPVFLRSTGEVVGIANAAIQDVFTGKTDVCFAVPIDVARDEIARR